MIPNQIVAVTGGTGFLGRVISAKLKDRGYRVHPLGSADYNLLDADQTAAMYRNINPDVTIHLAATVGGIGANKENPGNYFYNNMLMGLNVIHQAHLYNLQKDVNSKVVVVGTICAYPKYTPVPFNEANLWNGYPEETNAPYGIAKKSLLVMSQAYRQQYGLESIYLLPVNLYGPGDNFDPVSSHVIPALIRKFVTAVDEGRGTVTLWGTGNASREFLYVDDAAEAIILAGEHYNKPEPINIGAGQEIKIIDLAHKIANIVGFKGRLNTNPELPDGQPRRCLDVTKAKTEFGFEARTSLDDGLSRTVAWYRQSI